MDQKINRSKVTVVRKSLIQSINREEIVVGDLVLLENEEDVPCDILLLYTSNRKGCCYVTTANLDGEINLKVVSYYFTFYY